MDPRRVMRGGFSAADDAGSGKEGGPAPVRVSGRGSSQGDTPEVLKGWGGTTFSLASMRPDVSFSRCRASALAGRNSNVLRHLDDRATVLPQPSPIAGLKSRFRDENTQRIQAVGFFIPERG
ncbi:hypothetical protein KH5H1_43740 [Corallococcus caeni]|nr:hypothetical protein KH5H1_43740 [Corallococcus sp. KH5-1]